MGWATAHLQIDVTVATLCLGGPETTSNAHEGRGRGKGRQGRAAPVSHRVRVTMTDCAVKL